MEEGAESEQISDNFTCAVCLDVLYKPIVLVCGHVSCFWCCQHSMHMRSESHCPLCRHPYHHFPAICHTLHFLLKKLYPISYNRRNIQTLEDEKHSTLGFSLDIDSLVTSEEINNLKNVGQSSNSSFEEEFSVDLYARAKKLKESSSRTYKQISVSDVLCAVCKQLLFRPVVLNCGHVYCEGCITIPTEGMLKCQVCECRHPSGFPKVCRELDHFLEEEFSLEYALRRSIIQQNQEQNQSTDSSNEARTKSPMLSFPTKENFLKWLTVHESKFHDGVGCDLCGLLYVDSVTCKGMVVERTPSAIEFCHLLFISSMSLNRQTMCPILGDRYRCKDCTEICGYDLCGDCYNTGSKLPGRFNQKHTPTHRLELVKPIKNRSRDVIYRLLSGQLTVVSSIASRGESSPNNGSPNLESPPLEEDSVSSASSEDQSDNQPLI